MLPFVMRVRASAIMVCLALAAAPACADSYKYVDEKGVYTFTDISPQTRAKMLAVSKESAKRKTYRYYDPSAYETIIKNKAGKYRLDPKLVRAVIAMESGFNPGAISKKGAMGLMQLMPATAAELGILNPFNPEDNIEGGVRYLKLLIDTFGDLTLALAAYNAGPTAVETYGSVPPYAETVQYVRKVLASYKGKAYAASASKMIPKARPVAVERQSQPIYSVALPNGTVLYTNVESYAKKTPLSAKNDL